MNGAVKLLKYPWEGFVNWKKDWNKSNLAFCIFSWILCYTLTLVFDTSLFWIAQAALIFTLECNSLVLRSLLPFGCWSVPHNLVWSIFSGCTFTVWWFICSFKKIIKDDRNKIKHSQRKTWDSCELIQCVYGIVRYRKTALHLPSKSEELSIFTHLTSIPYTNAVSSNGIEEHIGIIIKIAVDLYNIIVWSFYNFL